MNLPQLTSSQRLPALLMAVVALWALLFAIAGMAGGECLAHAGGTCIEERRPAWAPIGVYGGLIDNFPMDALVNRSLTIRSGQCHVQRYMRPLLEHIERGDIDPSFVITHRLPLMDAPLGYELFLHEQDNCEKVVLKAA